MADSSEVDKREKRDRDDDEEHEAKRARDGENHDANDDDDLFKPEEDVEETKSEKGENGDTSHGKKEEPVVEADKASASEAAADGSLEGDSSFPSYGLLGAAPTAFAAVSFL